MAFDWLSDEILMLIVEFSGTKQYKTNPKNGQSYNPGLRALSRLTQCSHRLQRLAEPVLYAEYNQPEDNVRSLPLFLQSIVKRPFLAHYVRKATFISLRHDCPWDMSVITEDGAARIKDAIAADTTLDEKESQQALLDINEGYWDVLIALLLPLLSNLRKLNTIYYPNVDNDSDHFQRMLSHADTLQDTDTESPFALSSIKEISVNYADTEDGLSAEDIWQFMKLKSVTSFKITQMAHQDDDFVTDKDTKLKELHLLNSVISWSCCRALLLRCPLLESFIYTHGGSTVGFLRYYPSHIGLAIQAVKHSLKELVMENEHWGETYDAEEVSPIGSLVEFRHLVKIRVDAFMLIGRCETELDVQWVPATQRLAAVLPSALEELEMRVCQSSIWVQLKELLEYKETKFRKLKTVSLLFNRNPINDFERAAAYETKRMSMAVGVSLNISFLIHYPR